MSDDRLTRRNVRHLLLRRRNERIALSRDDRWPLSLRMHPDTLSELLIDGDPDERWTLDFEGMSFMRVPIVTDPRLPVGDVAVDWPTGKKAAR